MAPAAGGFGAGERKEVWRPTPSQAEKKAVEVGGRFVDLNPDFNEDFEIQAQVEEWLEEHLVGDKAASTQRAYNSAWQKWCDWGKRQGWASPYLDYNGDLLVNQNKVLGYLSYLGWLGTSVATMKQAVFAIEDAHKRAGHGDTTTTTTTTTKMHRLWIVLNWGNVLEAQNTHAFYELVDELHREINVHMIDGITTVCMSDKAFRLVSSTGVFLLLLYER